MVLRATREEDLVLRSEVAELTRRRRGRVHELVGPRSSVRLDRELTALVPDLVQRDVFVAGPPGFVQRVVRLMGRLGVPEDAIHFEEFAL